VDDGGVDRAVSAGDLRRAALRKEQAEAAAKKAAEWVQTPTGQQALRDSLERAKRLADEFRKAQIVDLSVLR
jgi:hypothetical protein